MVFQHKEANSYCNDSKVGPAFRSAPLARVIGGPRSAFLPLKNLLTIHYTRPASWAEYRKAMYQRCLGQGLASPRQSILLSNYSWDPHWGFISQWSRLLAPLGADRKPICSPAVCCKTFRNCQSQSEVNEVSKPNDWGKGSQGPKNSEKCSR